MQQDFACALRDAAPIATLLHTLALEWSAPRQLLKAMQVHYEGLSTRARMALAKITGWI